MIHNSLLLDLFYYHFQDLNLFYYHSQDVSWNLFQSRDSFDRNSLKNKQDVTIISTIEQ